VAESQDRLRHDGARNVQYTMILDNGAGQKPRPDPVAEKGDQS